MRKFLEEMGMEEETLTAVLGEHEKQLKQVRLEGQLHSAVAKAGGKNVKAIGALLDMAAIAESEDMAAAMETAVAALKESDGYLFAAPAAPYAAGTGTTRPELGKPATLAEVLRARIRK